MTQTTADTLALRIQRVVGDETAESIDMLSVEEPLEIRISQAGSDAPARSVAVTMRTPGNDNELAIGFLYTEGLVAGITDVSAVKRVGCNLVEVVLQGNIELNSSLLDRHSFIASSCGVCGKKSIEAVKARRSYFPKNPFPNVNPEIIHALPEKLRLSQKLFGTTGGIHASGLFDLQGTLLITREDVGRHNALDKLVGACAESHQLPLERRIIVVSGRASFELVQKAAHAGATILAAVGAPSSLAVELAQNSGMTLLGFARANRFNIYTSARDAVPVTTHAEPQQHLS